MVTVIRLVSRQEIYTLALKHDFLANCAINRHGAFHISSEVLCDAIWDEMSCVGYRPYVAYLNFLHVATIHTIPIANLTFLIHLRHPLMYIVQGTNIYRANLICLFH